MVKKRIFIILLLILFILIMLTKGTHAVLQANGSTPAKMQLEQWLVQVRYMEGHNGALGLEETINQNLTSSSGSNNLDIHMQKNTEYGAIAILSASDYGNPVKIESGNTTTGNETGIYINLNGEYVAAHNSYAVQNAYNYGATQFRASADKYKNVYDYSPTYGPKKVGDAILETSGWHNGEKIWHNGQQYNRNNDEYDFKRY